MCKFSNGKWAWEVRLQYFTGMDLVTAALAKKGDPYSMDSAGNPLNLITPAEYSGLGLNDDPGKTKGWVCAELVSWCVYQLSGKTLTFGMDQRDANTSFGYPNTTAWNLDFTRGTVQNGVYLVQITDYTKAINTAGVLFNNPPDQKDGINHIAISVGNGSDVVSALASHGYSGVFQTPVSAISLGSGYTYLALMLDQVGSTTNTTGTLAVNGGSKEGIIDAVDMDSNKSSSGIPYDKDWYKIQGLKVGTSYTISAAALSMTSGRIAISLNDAEGHKIDINQIGNSNDDFVDAANPTFSFVAKASQYFISVSAGSADATSFLYATGKYNIQITQGSTPSVVGTVSIGDMQITEGNSGTKILNFTVTRAGGTAPFNVNYSTADGTATTADGDYVAKSGTLQFGSGINSQTVSITINGDTKVEADQTFFVNLSAPTNGASITHGQAIGTIVNDDSASAGAGFVSISDAQITEGNSGTKQLTFTVTRSGGTAAFNVGYATQDSGATSADGDYVQQAGTLQFGIGVNSKTFNVTVKGDTKYEPTEAFLVNLVNPTNGAIISDGQASGTITNDDAAPPTVGLVSISDAEITEGNSGTKQLTFTVTRTGGTAAFNVGYSTQDNSATTANSDYVQEAGTLQFGSGVNSKTLTIAINGDTKYEPTETFFVNLVNPTNGAVVSDGQAIGTITNDDAAPAVAGLVSIGDMQVTEGNSGTKQLTFTVTRSGGTAAFNIGYATVDGTATSADGDYVQQAGTLQFGSGVNSKTFNITINGDTKYEPTEAFFINLVNPTNGAILADAQAVGTITNDDTAPVSVGTVSIGDSWLYEGSSGIQSMAFTVTRSGGTAPFNVSYTTQDGGAKTSDSDYYAVSGTLQFGSSEYSKTIYVAINGDTKVESDEAFYMLLQNPTNGASITDGVGVGTIFNDDAAVTTGSVSINNVQVYEGNSGLYVIGFTVTRSGGSAPFNVSYATLDGGAKTSDADYYGVSGTLQFGSSEYSKTIYVAINGDTKVESDEAFYMLLQNPTNGATFSNNLGVATIKNDDFGSFSALSPNIAQAPAEFVAGTTGSDLLQSSNKSEVLFGGAGADTFKFAANFGNDTISDFRPAEDHIQFARGLFATAEAVLDHAANDGLGNVVISDDSGDHLTLTGILKTQLHSGDFIV